MVKEITLRLVHYDASIDLRLGKCLSCSHGAVCRLDSELIRTASKQLRIARTPLVKWIISSCSWYDESSIKVGGETNG